MKKLLMACCAWLALLGASSQVLAANQWLEGLTVEGVRVWWDGSQTIMEVKVKEPVVIPAPGCQISNDKRILSYWNTSGPNVWMQAWEAQLLSAQAQGLKVDFYLQLGTCSTYAGQHFVGINVRTN